MSRSAIGAAREQRLLETPTIGVIGLGYVGLPLGVAFGESGATVKDRIVSDGALVIDTRHATGGVQPSGNVIRL